MQGFDPNGPQFQDGPPQPPGAPQAQVVPPPGPSGLTLEQAANPTPTTMSASQYLGEPGPVTPPPQGGVPDYLSEYEQALAATRGMVAPAKMEYQQMPSVTPGFLLKNLLSFGMYGMVQHDQTERHNAEADKVNRGLELHAADLAQKVVAQKASSQDRANKDLIANANLALNIARTQLGTNRFAYQQHRDLWKDSVGAMRDAPKTPAEQRQMEADGWVPSKTIPSKWEKTDDGGGGNGAGSPKLTRDASGNWSLPGPGPAPGSPAAHAFDGGTGAGMSTDKLPGESTPDYVERKDRENKIKTTEGTAKATQAAKTGPYAGLALNDLDQLEQAIKESFPAGESPLAAKTTGGGQRWWQSQRGTNPGLTRIETIRSRIEGYIRAMGGASRMPKELMDAMLSGMPALTNNRERNLILVKQMRDSIKAASDEYPEPDASGQGVLQSPGGGSASANQPNKPTARRLSSGKLITEEP